jgi:pimeloyl-ACP methyl ester carboxylesterase
MDAATNRPFTPARIVALALVAALLGGLAYLRFAPAAHAASVPVGAKAGDLVLEPCTYATEDGGYGADCGTLVVPENRADPRSRLIALPVVRIHARSEHPAEPIIYLEGGPGGTNMEFEAASRFAEDHDVVLVGYRGVDGSVRLDCPEVESALGHSADFLSEKSFEAYAQAFRGCANRLTDEGVDLAGYGLVQQVDDMEAARVALGYDRVDLLSESAGTRTAILYSWRYPESIFRSVMVGVNSPGNYLWDPQAADEQIGRYADRCAADLGCNARTDDLGASVQRAIADIPDRWLFFPIKKGTVRMVSFFSLMQSTSQAGVTFDAVLSAAEGDASGLWFQSVLGDVLFPKLYVWGQYAAAGSIDFRASRDYFAAGGRELDANPGYAGTSFAWGGGRLADAWPVAAGVDEYGRVRPSDVQTLLIGGELDTSTPPQIASEELLPYLPNGKEVVLPGFGHTASLFDDQPEATARLINTYFDTGEVDTSLYRPQSVDFTPGFTGTALAKIVAGTMIGLALLVVISLLWMARRVSKRGGFGPKAATVLRSAYPIVLGLGGWFLALLIMLVTKTAVPFDDEVMAVLGVGAPIGLGIYWAWVHTDWSSTTKVGGWTAAMGGALVGGWVGFNAIEGLFALLTAIVGAAAGANATLLVLDISWDRSGRPRSELSIDGEQEASLAAPLIGVHT